MNFILLRGQEAPSDLRCSSHRTENVPQRKTRWRIGHSVSVLVFGTRAGRPRRFRSSVSLPADPSCRVARVASRSGIYTHQPLHPPATTPTSREPLRREPLCTRSPLSKFSLSTYARKPQASLAHCAPPPTHRARKHPRSDQHSAPPSASNTAWYLKPAPKPNIAVHGLLCKPHAPCEGAGARMLGEIFPRGRGAKEPGRAGRSSDQARVAASASA